ncbi:hypothetical protein PMIN06_000176 [Paraphaeosphaeria minitans]
MSPKWAVRPCSIKLQIVYSSIIIRKGAGYEETLSPLRLFATPMPEKVDHLTRIMLSKSKWCNYQFMVITLFRRTDRWNDSSARTLLDGMLSSEDLYVFSRFPRPREKILAVLASRRGDSTCARDVERI